jgi:tetratricopeptide (TPR) repeat protein
LVLGRDEVTKRVHFERGMVLCAESPLENEDLGPCLVLNGELSAGALAEARANIDPEGGVRQLAETLVNRELVVRRVVVNRAREIAARVVASVFGWEGGSARFEERPPAASVFETDVLFTVDVILRGIAGMAGFAAIHSAMGALDNRLRLRRSNPIPLRRLSLSATQGFILSRLDGNSALNDVLTMLPAGEEMEASRFLFGLLVLGVLEYDPPLGDGPFRVGDLLRDHLDRQALERMQEQMVEQAYRQIPHQNPHEILGVVPQASRPEIAQAYEQTKAQFSRDRLLPRVREKRRAELSVISSRLVEAYLTLTQVGGAATQRRAVETETDPDAPVEVEARRVEMDKAKSKVALEESGRVADAYYAKAKKYLREGDFHNAIQYGKLAISHNDSDARYYHIVGECQARNPEARWQRLAEENYGKATQLDPWNAEYWISLGRLYKKRGMKLRARKQFEEALKLVPNHAEVLAEIKELT